MVTRRHVAARHTRLPAYARGKRGVIDTVIGPHPLADANADGEERREWLYTVRFDASELWPEDGKGADALYLDLWESYLERA